MKNIDKKECSVMIANITYNPSGWRNLYINPKAHHSYAREYPGHESLNFLFDKKGVDNAHRIFGYVQWTNSPRNFTDGGVVLFYSNNTDEKIGQIVGIYCDVKILHERKYVFWKGFKNDKVDFNLEASKELSILFPIPLEANKYKKKDSKRLVGQTAFSYYDTEIAEKIIIDELIALSKTGMLKNEFKKLKNIYRFVTGLNFDEEIIDSDLIEQDEIVDIYKDEKERIINELHNLKEFPSEIVEVKNKSYKRDNKTIGQLKVLRDFKCQVCGTKIKKANGGYYIEAAHIKAKSEMGCETPDNILILCPNHHKEFDYGKMDIIKHTNDEIIFMLNDEKCIVNLKVE